jgi:hypothetical protein
MRSEMEVLMLKIQTAIKNYANWIHKQMEAGFAIQTTISVAQIRSEICRVVVINDAMAKIIDNDSLKGKHNR